ncbi:PAS domain-containing protein [Brevundimonas sp. NPDC092305]|uniref:PAS domain-containing protein n=1 Tax=Brevundimonas sp. NPDC092305 TaxID=3363957 RepID=UPI003824492F
MSESRSFGRHDYAREVSLIRAEGRSAERIRTFSWQETPLGPPDEWDPGLTAALNIMLETRFPMFLTWGDENLLFYNDAYEPALVGKSDCLARPFEDVFPEAWGEVGPVMARALAGESSYFEDFHLPLIRNSVLSSTWWSFSYSPVRKQDGNVAGVLGVVYETTRRFLSDEALRSSEAALQAVTDMAPSLLWRCDADGRLTWVNQRLQTYFGLTGMGETFWDDHVHPDDVSTAQAVHTVCMSEGRPFECQQRLRDAKGVERWFMVRCEQTFNTEGDVTGWCGSATDIDDWRVAADGLSQREELLRDFYGADATLLWVADTATRQVTPINPETRTCWALPADGESISWEAWADTVHPDDRVQFRAAFDRATGGATAQVKFRRLTEMGVVRRFQLTAFPVASEDGEGRRIGGLVVEVGQDIDSRIYLVESDQGRQNALAHALGRRGFRVRAFDSSAELERVSDDLLPGCVVLGVWGDVEPALNAAAGLKLTPRLPWIAIGKFESRLGDVVKLMKLGASDALSDPTPDAVAAASRAALALVKPETGERVTGGGDARQRIGQLTRREREVLEGLIAGGTNKTIAIRLSLSPRTVETHRSHLMDRLGVSTLADLIRLASEAGIVAKDESARAVR